MMKKTHTHTRARIHTHTHTHTLKLTDDLRDFAATQKRLFSCNFSFSTAGAWCKTFTTCLFELQLNGLICGLHFDCFNPSNCARAARWAHDDEVLSHALRSSSTLWMKLPSSVSKMSKIFSLECSSGSVYVCASVSRTLCACPWRQKLAPPCILHPPVLRGGCIVSNSSSRTTTTTTTTLLFDWYGRF